MPKVSNKFPDFKDPQSLRESASVCASVSCLLHIAQGEACSVNTRVKPIFQGEDAENLIKSFDSVYTYLKRSYDAFSERADDLERTASAPASQG